MNHGLSTLDPNLTLCVNFNVFAWQVVFFGAMVIGALWAQGKIEFDRIFDPNKTLLLNICAVSLLFFLLIRLGFTEATVQYRNRGEFSLVYLVNFVLLAYVLAWLLIAGPRSEHKLVAMIGRVLTWFFNLSFLRLLGRHSLLVYAWHVILVYIFEWCVAVGSLGKVSATAITLCGLILLALPAMYREPQVFIRFRSRPQISGKATTARA